MGLLWRKLGYSEKRDSSEVFITVCNGIMEEQGYGEEKSSSEGRDNSEGYRKEWGYSVEQDYGKGMGLW